jgi:hypothetical protein
MRVPLNEASRQIITLVTSAGLSMDEYENPIGSAKDFYAEIIQGTDLPEGKWRQLV